LDFANYSILQMPCQQRLGPARRKIPVQTFRLNFQTASCTTTLPNNVSLAASKQQIEPLQTGLE